ncbi:hypothetical protein BH18ACI4_BH18ACI4_00820 [soil metagenome]
MLPKPQHSYAFILHSESSLTIPYTIAFEFCSPKSMVVSRNVSTALTPMPKTSVDENCEPLYGKEEIRRPDDILRMNFPADDASLK